MKDLVEDGCHPLPANCPPPGPVDNLPQAGEALPLATSPSVFPGCPHSLKHPGIRPGREFPGKGRGFSGRIRRNSWCCVDSTGGRRSSVGGRRSERLRKGLGRKKEGRKPGGTGSGEAAGCRLEERRGAKQEGKEGEKDFRGVVGALSGRGTRHGCCPVCRGNTPKATNLRVCGLLRWLSCARFAPLSPPPAGIHRSHSRADAHFFVRGERRRLLRERRRGLGKVAEQRLRAEVRVTPSNDSSNSSGHIPLATPSLPALE